MLKIEKLQLHKRKSNDILIKKKLVPVSESLQHAANHFTIKSFTVETNIKRSLL